jgi:hypothetical protein
VYRQFSALITLEMCFSNLRQVLNNRDDVFHSRFSSVLPSRSMSGEYHD